MRAPKVHSVQHTREYASYNVTVWNPSGSSATMSGSIKACRIDDVISGGKTEAPPTPPGGPGGMPPEY